MKLSKLKKKILLVLYQGYKFHGKNSIRSASCDVTSLADWIWGDDGFYLSERTGQRRVKKSVYVSLRRSLKRLESDRLVGEDMVKRCRQYRLAPNGVSTARKIESEIMELSSLIKTD